MEQEGVITQDQVRLGARGTKVLWNPQWGDPPEFTQPGIIERVDQYGVKSDHQVVQSVESVVIFTPGNDDQALDIAEFLRLRARRGRTNAIEGSNAAPDIRATLSLRDALPKDTYPSIQANIQSIGQAQVIALRQSTGSPSINFPKPPWQTAPIEANQELVTYLVGEGVAP